MSKLVSGIGKAVGGIVKGVTKVFKAVTKSGIGKALLLASAVYLGGAALGMWNSPFSAINGVLGQAPPVAAAAGEAGTAASMLGPSAGADVAAMSGGAAAAPTAAATGAAASPATAALSGASPGTIAQFGGAAPMFQTEGLVSGVMRGAPSVLAPAASQTAGAGGWISNAMKNTLQFVKDNPLVSAMTLGGVQSALSPDAIDVLRERERLERERLAATQPNFAVAPGALGMTAPTPPQPLLRITGGPVYPGRRIA